MAAGSMAQSAPREPEWRREGADAGERARAEPKGGDAAASRERGVGRHLEERDQDEASFVHPGAMENTADTSSTPSRRAARGLCTTARTAWTPGSARTARATSRTMVSSSANDRSSMVRLAVCAISL